MPKILVVEDNEIVRKSILMVLAAENFEILEASNGREAIRKANEGLPDLIVCDVLMPETDGYAVLKTLRQADNTAPIPFIFLTALSDKTEQRRGMQLGADDYLTKPFTRAELLGAVASRLNRQAELMKAHISEVQQSDARLSVLEEGLRHALQREELMIYYQPQIDLKSGQIAGAEALLRWKHPTLGMVSPADFIPIAEHTGLIMPIGEWVLEQATQQAKSWQQLGFSNFRIAINMSVRQLYQPDFEQVVERARTEANLEANCLELELTESILPQTVPAASITLNALKASGICLAVDDFGTGYATLTSLRNYPFDTLKLDYSFIHDVDHDLKNHALVSASIEMAHLMGLEVIAEGVETPEELAFLQEQGCDQAQGYLFSRPIPAIQFQQLLLGNHFETLLLQA